MIVRLGVFNRGRMVGDGDGDGERVVEREGWFSESGEGGKKQKRKKEKRKTKN